jgi:RNA polymerase sigma-70 factor (ECF subfamily)
VIRARDEGSAGAEEALAKLCQIYWPPLFSFIRRQGRSVEDAQDLTQAFFARVLDKKYFSAADRQKGKLRSFLLVTLKHFLANEHDRAQALKRGGGQIIIPLDVERAEGRPGADPSHAITPDRQFEQNWALTLLEKVMADLRQEHVATGKTRQFDEFKGFITDPKPAVTWAEVAERLGATEAAVKMTVSRLRQRYRQLLRAEIARTVSSPDEVDDEIRHLFAMFGD